MTRILNIEPLNYSDKARAILHSLGTLEESELTRAELIARIPEVDILIVRLSHQIGRDILDAAARLRVIVSATTGLDHIDLDYAAERSVTVLSLRGYTAFLRSVVATAEHTWGLLLALTRRIPWAFDSVRAGEWERDRFKGHDLRGRRLGICGLGRIGEHVSRYALAFGMTVFAYDPYRADDMQGVTRCASLQDLLAQSDVFTIHVPLNAETTRLIGTAELATLPRGALLINTARGDVIDETALIVALESGALAGAAVDVVIGERGDGLNPLIAYACTHDTLLLTPHLGGATYEAMEATEVFMAQQLATLLTGKNTP
ncbi:MAG: hydroxyacid dehydrogenase [Anaerolineae bacterium]|nr:hydroxyacid dehydrogenase [Anaerolineae bacterium]NUQ06971.1 hydroxyacid dehydrogenase [Anaerolineae bacterium]